MMKCLLYFLVVKPNHPKNCVKNQFCQTRGNETNLKQESRSTSMQFAGNTRDYITLNNQRVLPISPNWAYGFRFGNNMKYLLQKIWIGLVELEQIVQLKQTPTH